MELDLEVYGRARIAAKALLTELEPIVLGQKLEALSCCCGAIHYGPATVVAVKPGGMDPGCEDLIGFWYSWRVELAEDDNPERRYTRLISEWIGIPAAREMFHRYFDGVGVRVSGE